MKVRSVRAKIALLSSVFLLLNLVFVASANLFASPATATNNKTYSDNNGDSRMISIFADGKQINVRSVAATVEEAIARADIVLNDGDKVEPALNEQINADNFNINIYRARDVVIFDGNYGKHIKTASTSPAEIAAEAGIELLEADKVVLTPYDGFLESGSTNAYRVKRAKVAHVSFYGKQTDIRTQAKTVGELLKEQNIDSDSEKNWISVSLDTKVTDGMEFSILPQGIQSITVEEEIAFSEKVIYDYDIDYGKREIQKYGQNGQKTVTYEVDMRDGIELSRTVLSEVVTKEPVAQEVKVGMKQILPAGSHEDWMAAAGISPSDYGYVNYIITHESHWNPLARNRSSGAYGVCQALPANKMASAGDDWETNPVTQLKWCSSYAVGRYGSWQKAYETWVKKHWW